MLEAAILTDKCVIFQIAGPSLFGFLLTKYNPVACLKFVAGIMIFAFPILVSLYVMKFTILLSFH